MAELKTKPTGKSVSEFLSTIADEGRRRDCRDLAKLMRAATGSAPKMWGPSIVGFGSYHYEYASGRSGDWFQVGFSPRKTTLSLYLMSGFEGHEALLRRLGKHKTTRCCLYIKRLDDVDRKVLADLIDRSAETTGKRRSATGTTRRARSRA